MVLAGYPLKRRTEDISKSMGEKEGRCKNPETLGWSTKTGQGTLFRTELVTGLCGLGCPLLGMSHLKKAELCKLAYWPQGLTSGGHLGCTCWMFPVCMLVGLKQQTDGLVLCPLFGGLDYRNSMVRV